MAWSEWSGALTCLSGCCLFGRLGTKVVTAYIVKTVSDRRWPASFRLGSEGARMAEVRSTGSKHQGATYTWNTPFFDLQFVDIRTKKGGRNRTILLPAASRYNLKCERQSVSIL